MGEPIGKTYSIKSLHEWKYNAERNAVASGFLKIEADGDYEFVSNNFYSRNMLLVDGAVLVKYHDVGANVHTISLKKGLVPIVSVGYVEARGSVKVRWRPPGQKELSEIPGKLFFH